MAGISYIETGTPVPVVVQLADGDINQFPQAEIRDDEGNVLATLDLTHEESGLYVSAVIYTMPIEPYIKITYIVYEDDVHETESKLYLRDLDVFIRSGVQASITDLNNLSASDVQDVMTAQGYTEGRADKLDNLDEAISFVLTAIGLLENVSITDIQSAMTTQGYTPARAVLLDDLGQILIAVEKIRKVTTNKIIVNLTDTQIEVFEDNGTSIAFSFSISNDRRIRTPL